MSRVWGDRFVASARAVVQLENCTLVKKTEHVRVRALGVEETPCPRRGRFARDQRSVAVYVACAHTASACGLARTIVGFLSASSKSSCVK